MLLKKECVPGLPQMKGPLNPKPETGLAPDDRAGGVVDKLAALVNVLAVGLHVELLQVRREAHLS